MSIKDWINLILACLCVVGIVYYVQEVESYKNTLVQINNYRNDNGNVFTTASGVVIDSNKYRSLILTNKHVCASFRFKNGLYSEVELYLVNKSTDNKAKGTIIKVYDKNDLCLISTSKGNLTYSSLGNPPKIGDKVINISNPLTLQNYITEGYVGNNYMTDGELMTMVSIAVYNGCSGSGIFKEGKLVGLVSSRRPDAYNLTYVVPISTIKKFLEY